MRDIRAFSLVAVELAVLLLFVYRFQIEEHRHFFPLLCLAAAGFAVHAWLAPRLRAGFFVLLSLAGILFLLSWQSGLMVIGVGAGLIAVCHLPIPLILRVSLLGLAGLLLAALRVDYPEPFWPVLGSMFMFRLIVYVYETRHERGWPSALTLAYFFPLPNACFLFFPIVDFKTLRATYGADSSLAVAQVGVGWIARGLAHLLAFRVIKYYVLPAPQELTDVGQLSLFLAANYALYLHVSGTFHIITGIFHLFGFALPRTHDCYFLASSFTDIWRRINVYWTSFMMKIFFNPAVYALRGWGMRVAVGVAGLCVFVATWLLHIYQAFWITGALPFSLYEGGLWLLVGVFVAFNLQLDLTRAARPRRGEITTTLWSATSLSVRVVGMFVLVSVFWGCWNTPGILRSAVEQIATNRAFAGGVSVVAVLLAAVAVGVLVQFMRHRLDWLGELARPASQLVPQAYVLALAGAVVMGMPQVASVFGPRPAVVIASLQQDSATATEAARAVQGYYEGITEVRPPTSAFLAALEGRPTKARSAATPEMTRTADPLLERELVPGWRGEIRGSLLTINRFGMRDRPERSQKKPARTCRVAVVGSSVVMGFGVGDAETFPHLLEDQLSAGGREGTPRIEFLNFGTGRSYVIQRRVLIDRKVFAFEPDAICYVAHQDEFMGAIKHLGSLIAGGTELPYACLRDVVRKAGIKPDTSQGMTEALLQPLARDIVLGVYRDLAAECRRRDVALLWVYVPIPGVMFTQDPAETFVAIAKEAGLTAINLEGWDAGHMPAQLNLSPVDPHPNGLGQRLIAERFAEILRQRPDALPGCAKLN